MINKNNNFELFIKQNFLIISTLFHINENAVQIIDDKTRIIKRNFKINRLFEHIPILKTILEDFFKDYMIIGITIKEEFIDNNNQYIYKINCNKDDLKHFNGYLKLTQDNNNKNKINASISFDKTNNNIFDFENINILTEELIFQSISNFYKSTFLENDLKPLIKKLSHHFFELNII